MTGGPGYAQQTHVVPGAGSHAAYAFSTWASIRRRAFPRSFRL